MKTGKPILEQVKYQFSNKSKFWSGTAEFCHFSDTSEGLFGLMI
jgi:hypothetical protein